MSIAETVQAKISQDSRFHRRPIEVSQNGETVVLSGHCQSYYEKSLLSEAAKSALETCESATGFRIDNQVQVFEN